MINRSSKYLAILIAVLLNVFAVDYAFARTKGNPIDLDNFDYSDHRVIYDIQRAMDGDGNIQIYIWSCGGVGTNVIDRIVSAHVKSLNRLSNTKAINDAFRHSQIFKRLSKVIGFLNTVYNRGNVIYDKNDEVLAAKRGCKELYETWKSALSVASGGSVSAGNSNILRIGKDQVTKNKKYAFLYIGLEEQYRKGISKTGNEMKTYKKSYDSKTYVSKELVMDPPVHGIYGRICTKFREKIKSNGGGSSWRGYACREPDGSWEIDHIKKN